MEPDCIPVGLVRMSGKDKGKGPNYETAAQAFQQKAAEKKVKRSRSSSSSESSSARRKKKVKQQRGGLSNFSAFDKGGDSFTGKSHEDKTAEEKLEELMRGEPMDLTERDQFRRKQAQEDKEQMENAAKEKEKAVAAAQFASEACVEALEIEAKRLKPGDKVEIFGLTSEAGQKLNGKKAAIAKFEESSGRWMVEMLRGLSTFHSLKAENLKKL